jgi:hypothetical protein
MTVRLRVDLDDTVMAQPTPARLIDAVTTAPTPGSSLPSGACCNDSCSHQPKRRLQPSR